MLKQHVFECLRKKLLYDFDLSAQDSIVLRFVIPIVGSQGLGLSHFLQDSLDCAFADITVLGSPFQGLPYGILSSFPICQTHFFMLYSVDNKGVLLRRAFQAFEASEIPC